MSSGATAKLLRSWSQRAFISGRESWDEISPARRFQWESFAKAMTEEGYRLADPATVADIRLDVEDLPETDDVDWIAARERVRTWLDAASAGGGDGNG